MKYISIAALALALTSYGHHSANAASFTISDTAPAGFVQDSLDAYVGQTDFDMASIGDWVGSAQVFAAGDNVSGIRSGSDTTAFFAVQAYNSQTLQLSTTDQLVFEVYTPDTWNIIVNGDTTVTGAAFTAIEPGPIFLTFAPQSAAISFYATQPALEFSIGHIDSATATPETSTYVMMLMGFAGLGYAGMQRRRNPITAA